MKKAVSIASAVIGAVCAASSLSITTPVRAEPVPMVEVTKECPATAVSTFACIVVVVTVSELFKHQPFGDNGEVMKALDIHPSELGRCGIGGCSDKSVVNEIGHFLGLR